MRHVIVTRVTFALVALFVAAAVIFALLTSQPESVSLAPAAVVTQDGAALFERHCASCHAANELAAATDPVGAARRRELETFLTDHGGASGEDNRRILDYLAAEFPRGRD